MFNNMNKSVIPENKFNLTLNLKSSYMENRSIETRIIEKKRLLIPVPTFMANIMATFFQLLPKPLLTEDQLRLLKYDNITSGRYKTNIDIGLPAKCLFEKEVEKYCYMWRDGGQFSKKNFNSE